MSKKCVIKINENGPAIESNGTIVASDLKLTFKDYIPSVTNWTTWNGILNEGQELDITTPYKFICIRARNSNTPFESPNNIGNPNFNLMSACNITNNSLSNCGCSSNTDESSSDVLLDFEMTQFTTYELSEKTLYSDNEYTFDCSNGIGVTGVTGWVGCTCVSESNCGETGATGVTGATGGVIGATGGTCSIGLENVTLKGIYNYKFTGVLRNYNIVFKTSDAESDYKCKLDYYSYVKADDNKVLFIFDDTHGKWLLIRLDTDINEVIENDATYNIIEIIQWGETNETYKDSNITMPGNGYVGTNSFEGSIRIEDENMPVKFKLNSIFVLECDSFSGKIISRLDNMDVSILLAI